MKNNSGAGWSILGLFVPWAVVLDVMWIGLRWTVIALAAVYAAAFLIAVGVEVGRSTRV